LKKEQKQGALTKKKRLGKNTKERSSVFVRKRETRESAGKKTSAGKVESLANSRSSKRRRLSRTGT